MSTPAGQLKDAVERFLKARTARRDGHSPDENGDAYSDEHDAWQAILNSLESMAAAGSRGTWGRSRMIASHDAQDIAQTTVLKFYDELKKENDLEQDPDYATNWLYRVQQNCINDLLRKQKRRSDRGEVSLDQTREIIESESSDTAGYDNLQEQNQRQRVEQALDEAHRLLPRIKRLQNLDGKRWVFECRRLHKLKCDEIRSCAENDGHPEYSNLADQTIDQHATRYRNALQRLCHAIDRGPIEVTGETPRVLAALLLETEKAAPD